MGVLLRWVLLQKTEEKSTLILGGLCFPPQPQIYAAARRELRTFAYDFFDAAKSKSPEPVLLLRTFLDSAEAKAREKAWKRQHSWFVLATLKRQFPNPREFRPARRQDKIDQDYISAPFFGNVFSKDTASSASAQKTAKNSKKRQKRQKHQKAPKSAKSIKKR